MRPAVALRITLALALLGLPVITACNPFAPDLRPKPLDAAERGEYEGPEPEMTGPAAPGAEVVSSLARVFYVRITDRRFNSLSTYHDPALRELFHSPEAFADYFAALADGLTLAHFEALRPYEVVILRLDVLSPNVILVTHRYRGDNSLPLRFWSVSLERVDRWERSDGRWYVIPGKL
jgi:hypothetical protein